MLSPYSLLTYIVILGDVVENTPWVEHVLAEAKALQYCLKTWNEQIVFILNEKQGIMHFKWRAPWYFATEIQIIRIKLVLISARNHAKNWEYNYMYAFYQIISIL